MAGYRLTFAALWIVWFALNKFGTIAAQGEASCSQQQAEYTAAFNSIRQSQTDISQTISHSSGSSCLSWTDITVVHIAVEAIQEQTLIISKYTQTNCVLEVPRSFSEPIPDDPETSVAPAPAPSDTSDTSDTSNTIDGTASAPAPAPGSGTVDCSSAIQVTTISGDCGNIDTPGQGIFNIVNVTPCVCTKAGNGLKLGERVSSVQYPAAYDGSVSIYDDASCEGDGFGGNFNPVSVNCAEPGTSILGLVKTTYNDQDNLKIKICPAECASSSAGSR